MAPPGNQAVNGKNQPEPVVSGETGLLDSNIKFMAHINMKECLKCGYERQPKDDGIVPLTECPRCGILYDKIKDGDEGLKDAAGKQHKERKEFQKDSSTFGSEEGSLMEESKNFPISKVSIIRSALIPLLLTIIIILTIIIVTLPINLHRANLPRLLLYLLIIVSISTIIVWLPFLRRPFEIVLVHKQLTLKAPIRTVKVKVGDLTSVKDIMGGFFTRFKSKEESVDSINISEWDELIKIIKSINPAVEIKRYSKVSRMIGIWIYPVLMTLLTYSYFGSLYILFVPYIGKEKAADTVIESITPQLKAGMSRNDVTGVLEANGLKINITSPPNKNPENRQVYLKAAGTSMFSWIRYDVFIEYDENGLLKFARFLKSRHADGQDTSCSIIFEIPVEKDKKYPVACPADVQDF